MAEKRDMEGEFRIGEWRIQPQLNRIQAPQGQVRLEPKVMDVLVYFARHAGEVLPKERIIQAVWPDTFVSDEALTRAIWEIRKAFQDGAKDSKIIETIPRRGYRLAPSVTMLEGRRDSSESGSGNIIKPRIGLRMDVTLAPILRITKSFFFLIGQAV